MTGKSLSELREEMRAVAGGEHFPFAAAPCQIPPDPAWAGRTQSPDRTDCKGRRGGPGNGHTRWKQGRDDQRRCSPAVVTLRRDASRSDRHLPAKTSIRASEVALDAPLKSLISGGRYWDRTSGPCRVKAAHASTVIYAICGRPTNGEGRGVRP